MCCCVVVAWEALFVSFGMKRRRGRTKKNDEKKTKERSQKFFGGTKNLSKMIKIRVLFLCNKTNKQTNKKCKKDRRNNNT